MKKFLSLSIIALLLASSFTACKKGENDPFSLRSRKARLTGVWKLKSADYKITYVENGNTDVTTYSYDGTTMTRTTDGDGTAYTYSETIEIKKDGTFSSDILNEGRYFNTDTYEWETGMQKEMMSGVWYFLEGNKELGVKNKEKVQFLIEKYKKIAPDGSVSEQTYEGIGEQNIQTILLDRLSNKELISLLDNSYVMGGDYEETKGTKTYEKKK